MKSLLRLARGLFDDLKRLHPEVKGLDRDYETIEARFKNEGSGFFSVALPAYGKAFDLSLASGRMSNVAGFASNGQIPKFLRGIVSHVFDPQTGLLQGGEDVAEYILSARQVFYFFKKFLPGEQREQLLSKLAIREFQEVDSSIAAVPTAVLEKLRRVASYILPNLEGFEELRCKHGPGAVAERIKGNQKWNLLSAGLSEFDPRLCDAGYDLEASLRDWSDVTSRPATFSGSPSARLVTVPKSCTALRTITVEPCLNQFVQQGLNDHLRTHIRLCPVMRVCLTLDDQRPNQKLAVDGSLSGDWSTIDLSSASDLLSQQVVEAIFGRFPRFYELMQNSRTPSISLGSNQVYTMKKYAGMGNATTFPVQSVSFAVIAMASMLPEFFGYREVQRVASKVRVFGDDIIVKTNLFKEVSDWLSLSGLKINRSKTFSEGNFRESCGVDAFKGVDVTPCYLRYLPELSSTSPNAYAGLVSTCNQLWMRAYYSCSNVLKSMLEVKMPLPLVDNKSSALGWHTRQNVTTYQRWSRSLHRFELRTMILRPERTKDKLEGTPALLKFFHSPQLAEYDKNHLSETVFRFRTKLRRGWVPSR